MLLSDPKQDKNNDVVTLISKDSPPSRQNRGLLRDKSESEGTLCPTQCRIAGCNTIDMPSACDLTQVHTIFMSRSCQNSYSSTSTSWRRRVLKRVPRSDFDQLIQRAFSLIVAAKVVTSLYSSHGEKIKRL